jgi:hypothetical protein
MKRNLLSTFVMMIAFVLAGFTAQAQDDYVVIEDFEGAGTLELQVFANGSWEIPEALEVIDNPDQSGLNPSNKVLQFTRGADGDPWAGFFTDLEDPIDFSERGYIHFQVWKPIASRVMFKVEGSTIGASPVEVEAMEPQEDVNEWVNMVFDLSALEGGWARIVFFLDFPASVEHDDHVVMYMDNVIWSDSPEPVNIPVYSFVEDFEGAETLDFTVFENGSWTGPEALEVINNPDQSALNPSHKVLQFNRAADGQPWAGFFTNLEEPLDFSERGYIHFQVWKPIASRVMFKVEDNSLGADPVEIEAMEPQEAVNEWVNMVFDLSELEGEWGRIVFFLDFPGTVDHDDDVVIYMDNIIWSTSPDPVQITAGEPPVGEGSFMLAYNVGSSAGTAIYREEHYSVWVSTTGTDAEDFTMVFEETLSQEVPNWDYQPREVDISAYAGQEIHVAFRHNESTDMDRLVIFDVAVKSMVDGETGLSVFSEDFTGGVDHEDGVDWLPAGWLAVDADGDEYNWYFNQFDGDGYMLSRSVIQIDGEYVPLTPDNWLITPAILLEEPYTIWNVVQDSEDHETLESLLLLAGLEGALQGEGPLTLFAPTDAAIAALPEEVVDAVVADPEGLLTNLLLYHVVAGVALSTDLEDGQEITTLLGQDILVTITGEGVFINDAQVTVADVVASNGVVHVINAVLIPEVEEPPAGFEVTFNVNMAGAVAWEDLVFDPAVHRVWVTGSFAEWAQPGSNPDFELHPADTGKNDVEIIYPGNWENRAGEATYVWGESSGYVFGTNTYEDKGYGQIFRNDQERTIIGGYFWIGERNGTGGSIAFNLWDYSGNSVGSVLASKTYALEDVDAAETFEDALYVEFDEPVTVTGDFFMGADISGLNAFQLGTYGIGHMSSQDGDGNNAGLSLVQEGSTWVSVLDYEVNVDLAVFPVAQLGDEPPLEDLIYTLTTNIEAGEYEYKYFVVVDDPTWDHGEWPGDPNRQLVVEEPMVVNDVFGQQPDDPTNVDEPLVEGFAVYPNPVRDMLNIQSASNIDQIRVFDLSGRVIHQADVNDTHIQLNVNPLNRGMYILQIISGNDIHTERFQVFK